MSTLAKTIVSRCQSELNDVKGVRYPASLLCIYINQAQRDMQTLRPDVTATSAEYTLVAGHEQQLPDDAASLIEITSHVASPKGFISKADEYALNSVHPGWRNEPQRSQIVHWLYDIREPRSFGVYPPAIAGTKVHAKHSAYPVDVPNPTGDGKTADTVIGNVSVEDKWVGALHAMVMHYAYSKDLEGAGNMQLSQMYLQKAMTMLGIQLQADKSISEVK